MQDYVLQLTRELRQRNYSPRTVEIYSNSLKFFLKRINNDVALISREKIIDFILYLQSKEKAPKTVNLYKEVIKFFCGQILKLSLPFDIKLSKEARKLPIILSRGEIQKILDSVTNTKHKTLLSLAYGAGLRVSETVTLRVSDGISLSLGTRRFFIHKNGSTYLSTCFTKIMNPKKSELSFTPS